MTKKRVKFGLAILGVLAVFLLALLALVFAPTGASAGKGPVFGQEQDGGQSGHPNLAYLEPPAGNEPDNGPGHSDSDIGSCVGPLCDTHDFGDSDSWHYADGPGGQGGGNNQGNSPNPNSGDQGGNGYPPSLFVGGYPGGFPGGGYGAPQGQSSSCTPKKDKDEDAEDKESGDKSCEDDNNDNNSSDNSNNSGSNNDNNSGNNNGNNNNGGDDAGSEQLLVINGNTPPNNFVNDDQDDDDDLPPVDPNCFPFTEGCDTHGGNPPTTDLTDPPSEVPEPLTLSLFALGLTGTAALRRRSRQKTAAQPD